MATASITFTTDQSLFDLFTTAACAAYGYQANVPDPANPGQTIPNPQTPTQFAQQVIVNFATDVVKAYQAQQASQSAGQQAVAAVQTQVNAYPLTVTAS